MTMKKRRATITIAFTLFALCIIGVVSASILSENGKRPLYYLNNFTVHDEMLLGRCDYYYKYITEGSKLSNDKAKEITRILGDLRVGEKLHFSVLENELMLRCVHPCIETKLITGHKIMAFALNGFDETVFMIDDSFYKITDDNKDDINKIIAIINSVQ